MFDLPARFGQDEKLYAVRIRTRAHFRKAEEREIQAAKAEGDDQLRFSELRDEASKTPLDRGFIGFVSQGIFDETGDLIGDTATAAMAALGRNLQPRKFGDSDALSFKNTQGFSSTQQHAVVLQAGLETLPRSTAPPFTHQECGTTRLIIDSQACGARQLSNKALQILRRTNYKHDRSLSYNLRGDIWATGRRMIRRRGMQVTASIMWTSLDRGDYEQAHKALAVLLRSDGIIMRNLWMPALELLAWEQSRTGSVRTARTPIAFLDWLIVNYPSVPNSAALWRKIPRAENFRPLVIMNRLKEGDYRGAMEKAEEAMLTIPSSVDPLCWALAGLAALKMENASGETRTRDARRYFRRCMELGGVLPRRFSDDLESEPGTSKQELDAESPTTGINSRSDSDSDAELGLDSNEKLGSSRKVSAAQTGAASDSSSTVESSSSESESSSDDEPPSKRVKLEENEKMGSNSATSLHTIKLEPESHLPPDTKAESLSQSPGATVPQGLMLGARWSDSDSEGDPNEAPAEIKAETPSQLTQGMQSQGLGMSWTDSDSEDDN